MLDLNLLAEAAHGAAEHAEASALGLGPGGWVALSMIALIAIMLYLKVPALVASMLDKKIEGIRKMLDEAATLRSEAEALKAEYERKVANATKHAEELRTAAEHEATLIVEKARTDAAALVARREKMAEDKIAAAERAAVADLRAKAAEAAAVAARGLIRENHSAAADKALVDQAISGI
jgi:F-type H+-transporting ATPase subunit b